MKKITLAFLIFTLIFYLNSCNLTKLDNTSLNNKTFNNNNPIDLNIYKYSFYGSDQQENISERETFYDMMLNNYNVNISINGIGSYINDEIIKSNNLICVDAALIGELIEKDLIVPIDMYIQNNDNWNNLDNSYTSMVEYNNKVYGIPLTNLDAPIFASRFVRKDWLDNLSLVKPETLTEYYETMRAFTYDDPNANNVNDTFGFVSEGLYGLDDIFNAFDCRIGNYEIYRPTYNPNSGLFEDGLSKDSMFECLQYIKSCVENNLLHYTSSTLRDWYSGSILDKKYYSNAYGSTFNFIKFKDEIEAETNTEHIPIFGLKGKNNSKIINAYMSYSHAYVLPKHVKNKSEVINSFINSFLGSEKGYLTSKYGLQGEFIGDKDYYFENNTIYLKPAKIKNDVIIDYEYSSLINYHPNYNFEVLYSIDGEVIENKSLYLSNTDKNTSLSYFFDNKNTICIYPQKYQNIDIEAFYNININSIDYYSKIQSLGTTTIENAILNNTSISDALEYYKQESNKLGTDLLIEYTNSLINK